MTHKTQEEELINLSIKFKQRIAKARAKAGPKTRAPIELPQLSPVIGIAGIRGNGGTPIPSPPKL